MDTRTKILYVGTTSAVFLTAALSGCVPTQIAPYPQNKLEAPHQKTTLAPTTSPSRVVSPDTLIAHKPVPLTLDIRPVGSQRAQHIKTLLTTGPAPLTAAIYASDPVDGLRAQNGFYTAAEAAMPPVQLRFSVPYATDMEYVGQKADGKKLPPPKPAPLPEDVEKAVAKQTADLDKNLDLSLERGFLHEMMPMFKQVADRVGISEWDIVATFYKEMKFGGDRSSANLRYLKKKDFLRNDPYPFADQVRQHKDEIIAQLEKGGPLLHKGVDYARRSVKGQKATPMDRLVETLNLLKCRNGKISPAQMKAIQNNIKGVPAYAALVGGIHNKYCMELAAKASKDSKLAQDMLENGYYFSHNMGSSVKNIAQNPDAPAHNYMNATKRSIFGVSKWDTNRKAVEKAAAMHKALKEAIKKEVDAGSTGNEPYSFSPTRPAQPTTATYARTGHGYFLQNVV